MPDDPLTNTGTKANGTSSATGVAVDPNKKNAGTGGSDGKSVGAKGGTPPPPAGVVVPDEAKKKYPDLVKLILKSESMNTEEQNYWLQVLPVMTPDQVAELRDILETEKKKLAAIDAKYSTQKGRGVGARGKQPAKKLTEEELKRVEEKRKKAQKERKKKEAEHKEKDEETAEDLLSQLDDL